MFDPDTSNIPALTDKTERIIWACIRYQHIVSQYFNDNVAMVVLRIAEIKPKNYEEFKAIIATSDLRVFGTLLMPSPLGEAVCPVLDDEFWRGVWEYVTGNKQLEMEVKL